MYNFTPIIESKFNDWQQIDVVISRDCTLRCTYCYLHKHKDDKYDFDKILKSLDRLLNHYHNNEEYKKEGVVIALYPEPWVNVHKTNETLKEILKILIKYPRFVENYMIMLGTNGARMNVEIPILKHIMDHLSINVTVDGVKEQHDLYRVFPDGSGSWDIIVRNVKKYQELYNIYSTKVTIGPETIKYIYDSALYLWNDLNLSDINMNVVFEDLWGSEEEKEQLLVEYEEQLSKLYNYITENKLWEKGKYISIIGSIHIPQLGGSLAKTPDSIEFRPTAYCGAASMRSIDVDGDVYPCFRLSPYSFNRESPFRVGESLKDDSVRALNFFNAYDSAQSKCLECPLLSSCSMCVGGAWEEKESLFWRTTHHCEFQKLQYKWALKLENYIRNDKGLKEVKNVL